MNIGNLYEFKKYFWFLYPSKDISAVHLTATFTGVQAADYSKLLNGNIPYIFPNSLFLLLEQNGSFIRILTNNGEVGWIHIRWDQEWAKDCIEEVNQ